MRALLTCVGKKDPYNEEGEEGPILSLCRCFKEVEAYGKAYLPIEAIYLLFTPSIEERALSTREILAEGGWEEVHPRCLEISDPTDYRELMPAMMRAIYNVSQEWGRGCEYLICVNSGTRQMETVWISLHNAGYLPQTTLLQKKEARYAPKEKQVREVDIEPLIRPGEFSAVQQEIKQILEAGEGIFCGSQSRRIWVDGKDVTLKLTAKERALVRFLHLNARAVCTKDAIGYAVWPEAMGGVSDEAIHKLISRVRQKIEPDPENPRYIITVRGEGYLLSK